MMGVILRMLRWILVIERARRHKIGIVQAFELTIRYPIGKKHIYYNITDPQLPQSESISGERAYHAIVALQHICSICFPSQSKLQLLSPYSGPHSLLTNNNAIGIRHDRPRLKMRPRKG